MKKILLVLLIMSSLSSTEIPSIHYSPLCVPHIKIASVYYKSVYKTKGLTDVITYPFSLVSDAVNYTKELVLYGFDTSRTFNVAIARLRDMVKSAYTLLGKSDDYKKLIEDLNTPQQEADEYSKKLYYQHVEEKTKGAHVRLDPDLCDQEKAFLEKRLTFTMESLSHYFKDPIFEKLRSARRPLSIAVCASGGGMRAKIATQGLLKVLEKKNEKGVCFGDCVSYVAGLSGSSWAFLPWSYTKSVEVLQASDKKYVKLPLTYYPSKIKEMLQEYPYMRCARTANEHSLFEEDKVVEHNILRKFYFNEPLDLIDLYGAVLGHILLAPFDDPELLTTYCQQDACPLVQSRQRIFFSQAARAIEYNNCTTRPLPIGTAIAPVYNIFDVQEQKMTKSKLQWFEFTPYEAGTTYFRKNGNRAGAYIPIWALGRNFEPEYEVDTSWYSYVGLGSKKIKGYFSSDNDPELTLSDLLATCGSAFSFSARDALRILGFEELLVTADVTSVDTIFKRILEICATIIFPPLHFVKNMRMFPSTVQNFMKDLPDTPLDSRTLNLLDAGIDFNLPFPALLREERPVDVIIALDASSPVTEKEDGQIVVPALYKAQEWAQARGVSFPNITHDPEYKKVPFQDITIFKDSSTSLIIIYIPLQDNSCNRGSAFSIKNAYENDIATTNFNYKETVIDNLAQHVEQTVSKNMHIIEEALMYAAQKKLNQL